MGGEVGQCNKITITMNAWLCKQAKPSENAINPPSRIFLISGNKKLVEEVQKLVDKNNYVNFISEQCIKKNNERGFNKRGMYNDI